MIFLQVTMYQSDIETMSLDIVNDDKNRSQVWFMNNFTTISNNHTVPLSRRKISVRIQTITIVSKPKHHYYAVVFTL